MVPGVLGSSGRGFPFVGLEGAGDGDGDGTFDDKKKGRDKSYSDSRPSPLGRRDRAARHACIERGLSWGWNDLHGRRVGKAGVGGEGWGAWGRVRF